MRRRLFAPALALGVVALVLVALASPVAAADPVTLLGQSASSGTSDVYVWYGSTSAYSELDADVVVRTDGAASLMARWECSNGARAAVSFGTASAHTFRLFPATATTTRLLVAPGCDRAAYHIWAVTGTFAVLDAVVRAQPFDSVVPTLAPGVTPAPTVPVTTAPPGPSASPGAGVWLCPLPAGVYGPPGVASSPAPGCQPLDPVTGALGSPVPPSPTPAPDCAFRTYSGTVSGAVSTGMCYDGDPSRVLRIVVTAVSGQSPYGSSGVVYTSDGRYCQQNTQGHLPDMELGQSGQTQTYVCKSASNIGLGTWYGAGNGLYWGTGNGGGDPLDPAPGGSITFDGRGATWSVVMDWVSYPGGSGLAVPTPGPSSSAAPGATPSPSPSSAPGAGGASSAAGCVFDGDPIKAPGYAACVTVRTMGDIGKGIADLPQTMVSVVAGAIVPTQDMGAYIDGMKADLMGRSPFGEGSQLMGELAGGFGGGISSAGPSWCFTVMGSQVCIDPASVTTPASQFRGVVLGVLMVGAVFAAMRRFEAAVGGTAGLDAAGQK